MFLLAIDPGTTESAIVAMEDDRICFAAKHANIEVLSRLIHCGWESMLRRKPRSYDQVVIEQVCSYGKPVGEEVFETVYWSGRFAEAFKGPVQRIKRPEIKMHLCHATAKVTDAVIRQRIIDLFGGKEKAIGRKASPGPLYGIKADVWQALALAITWREKYGNVSARA